MTNIPIDQRHKFVGASEVGALFGVHPQISKFRLHHQKRQTLPMEDISDFDRVFWGTYLEPSIAQGAAARLDLKIRKVKRYIEHPSIGGYGASLDYEIVTHKLGPGIMEIKCVDRLIWRDWPDDQPPMHMMLQLQAQLDCSNRKWGMIVALVGGNELHTYRFEAHAGAQARIRAEVTDFWADVAQENEPEPDYTADAAAIAAIYNEHDGDHLDMSDDERFFALCSVHYTSRRASKEFDDQKLAAKSEMLTMIGDASRVRCRQFAISLGGGFRLNKITVQNDAPEVSTTPVEQPAAPKDVTDIPSVF